jgi:hypothetical protein
VGDAGGQGGAAARLTTELRAAYDAAAGDWPAAERAVAGLEPLVVSVMVLTAEAGG